MKSIAIIMSLLVSVSSFAVTRNSSWEAINADRNVTVEAPQVAFNGSYTIFMNIMNTCYVAETDQLRTLNKVTKYQRPDSDNGQWIPVGKEYRYADRVYDREICGGSSDNCEWETIQEAYSLKPLVSVLFQPVGDRSFGDTLFNKTFSVPNCK